MTQPLVRMVLDDDHDLTTTTPGPARRHGGRGTYTCFYNGAAGLHWDVSVHQDPSRATLDDMLALLGDGQPVQGIGDKAYVSPVGMEVQLGDRLLWVGSGTGGSGTGNASSYEALAKAVIAALK